MCSLFTEMIGDAGWLDIVLQRLFMLFLAIMQILV